MSRPLPQRTSHGSAILLAVLLVLARVVDVVAAETGVTLTPDRGAYLVNKDLGTDRWTIGFNVVPGDPNRFINVTGNVFRSDGGPPAFVVCQVRSDSLGTLEDAASTFRFTCRGADACPSDATRCAAQDWASIEDDVPLPAAFFLPEGGLGAAVGAGGAVHSEVARRSSGVADPGVLEAPAVLHSPALAVHAHERPAQNADRGATLSFDRLSFLVNKDVQNERWSIALNVVPVETEAGTVARLQNVTGNVFKRDGSAPSFVFCTEREDSQGSLADPASLYRLSCWGASACTGTAVDCAQGSWTPISDDVALPASFFLPPDGLPAPVQSDPEIFVIGRTSDPSSIATTDYTVPEGAAAAHDVVAGGCPVDATCLARRIGVCEDVAGKIADIGGFGCACRVDDVPSQCIACGGGASGQCGGSCEFAVGGFAARGQCLPVSSDSGTCACYAIPAGGDSTVTGCSGPLDVTCGDDRCCADDPRDGCDLAQGDVTCAGICVSSSCAAGDACGICAAAQQGSVCPNGVREGNEQCDGTDVPSSCGELGLGTGPLRCTQDCRFDASGCGVRPTGTPIVAPTPTPDGTTPTPTGTSTQPTASPGGSTSTPTPTPTAVPTNSPGPTATAVPPTPTPQGDPCPYVVQSGDASGLDVVVNVGASSGTLTLTYEPFGDPNIGGDAFSVETLDGDVVFSSGCVFDPGPGSFPPLSDTFSFSGGPSLRLRVETFCNGGAGVDFWSVDLSCGA